MTVHCHIPGLRAPAQAVYAEHGVEVLQEHQPRMEAPGRAPSHYCFKVHRGLIRLSSF